MKPSHLASISALVAITIAHAGPLTPPPGPPTSTDTILRADARTPIGPDTTPGSATATYRITAPGSYYLTENIQGVAFGRGIEITTSNVTLDLNGFGLLGVPDVAGGIILTTTASNIKVHNGFASDWNSAVVALSTCRNAHVSDIRVDGFGSFEAISVGDDSVVTDCVINDPVIGIQAGQGALIARCTVRDARIRAFDIGGASTIIDCAAFESRFAQFDIDSDSTVIRCLASTGSDNGFRLGQNTRVIDSIARGHALDGFNAGPGSHIEGSYARNNNGTGFRVSSGTIRDSIARANDTGFSAASTLIADCHALENNNVGFDLTASRLERSAATSNALEGIFVNTSSTVVDSNAAFNGSAGISVGPNSHIARNNTYSNLGAGIIVIDSESLIDQNRVAKNAVGILVQAGIERNLIIRNIARANAGLDFIIPPNNRVGVISIAPLSGAISTPGDPAALGVGTTDPWANLVY